MPTSWSSLASLGRTLLGGAAQLIYPNTCWVCGNIMQPMQQQVCSACLSALTVDPFSTCPRCSSTVGPHLLLEDGCPECQAVSFAFDGAFRMAPYEGQLREVILRMKQWTGEDLAEVIGALWAKRMAERLAPLQADVAIPVPLHWIRRWRRGFNSCDILALTLARELGIPCWTRVLRRARATAQQSHQSSATARRENVKHAFQAKVGDALHGKTVLLIDDVLMLFSKKRHRWTKRKKPRTQLKERPLQQGEKESAPLRIGLITSANRPRTRTLRRPCRALRIHSRFFSLL